MADDQVYTVRGDEELVARAGHLFAATETEFLCAARDLNTWSEPRLRMSVRSRIPVGTLRVRKLLSPVALAGEEHRLDLRQLLAQGAQVRISAAPLPHETIIIDRRVMILAGRDGPGAREYTVTTSPTLVSGVYALFDAAWESATDFDAYLRGDAPQLDAEHRAILQALASGATDETAARRLGVSLRTYRRRVAELLESLEADSRFQAGLRAGGLGLTG